MSSGFKEEKEEGKGRGGEAGGFVCYEAGAGLIGWRVRYLLSRKRKIKREYQGRVRTRKNQLSTPKSWVYFTLAKGSPQ